MVMFFNRASGGAVVVALAAVLAFSCSDNGADQAPAAIQPSSPYTTGGAGADSSTGGIGAASLSGSGGTVLKPIGCEPSPCPEGTYCSVALQCIAIGTCLDDLDCGGGQECDETGQCTTGGGCGTSEFDLTSVPPNLLLVLDRSCSMTQSRTTLGEDVSEQKWVPVIDALVQVTTDLSADIRFGLEVFPDGTDEENTCAQNPTGEITVPIGPDGGTQTASVLQAARTDDTHPIYPGDPCETNTWSALVQASQQPELDDPERASYIVLITDGEPYCSDRSRRNETDDALINEVIADLAARGVPTFVVGFGDVGDVDPEALARYAASGGTTPSAEQPYYDAANGEQLLAAMRTIADTIVSCEYALGSAPPDDDLYVFFNDEIQVPRDPMHAEGWDFNPNNLTLSFYGTACQMLQNDEVLDIDVVYGCPDPTVG